MRNDFECYKCKSDNIEFSQVGNNCWATCLDCNTTWLCRKDELQEKAERMFNVHRYEEGE